MLTDPSTTWLYVSKLPDEVMMSPVPAAAAEPLAVWMTVLMSTMAGETFRVMVLMSRLLLPLEVLCWMGWTVCTCACVGLLRLLMNPASAQPAPTPPPVARMTAATIAASRRRVKFGDICGEAAAGAGGGASCRSWEVGSGVISD